MASKLIAQRDLRNDVGAVLRAAEAGQRFTVTVRGRPVATLGPIAEDDLPRTELGADAITELFARTPVDDRLAADLRRLRELEPPVGDPWPAQ
jgi:prevent-host-death family protein